MFAFSNRCFTEKKLLGAPDFTRTYDITAEHLQYEIMVMTQVQLLHHLMKKLKQNLHPNKQHHETKNQQAFFLQLQVASIATMIFSHFILHPTFLPSDFQMLIISTSSNQGFITNRPNDLLSVESLARLVRHCISNAEVQGLNSVQA